jgi:hypothetical protein
MTTLFPQSVTCAACGRENEITVIGSTNTMGPPDLDTRPAEMARSTMSHWLQECAHCGFLSRDLRRPHQGTLEIVGSDAYKSQRRDPAAPDSVNRFLCAAMLLEKTWATAGAFWNVLAAAWCADDAGDDALARRCRLRAIDLALASAEPISRQAGAPDLILADLYRRTGQFAKCLELAGRPAPDAEPIILKLMEFERTLAAKDDAACHSGSEIP